ncbi:hypothetical protein LTR78_001800 [Recurvomyces mirabilis]|uniref:Uncharacterized protein n=1 Tax=Recurvomyces mirabilis TaxID=574656 RepID=A0AAE0WVA1_9PEZI|nr:hypothetical protein LTR78_001800 [Recurvomyces mirabilis]KAK5156760.1 hypothetical protein LTS14_004973 [Recurvomyces mirabilis]
MRLRLAGFWIGVARHNAYQHGSRSAPRALSYLSTRAHVVPRIRAAPRSDRIQTRSQNLSYCDPGWQVVGLSHSTTRRLSITQRRAQVFKPDGSFAVGAEPGFDLNGNAQVEDAQVEEADAQIKIIDYSADRVVDQDVGADDLKHFLSTQPKPDWATCRWVYVNGISRNVVHTLGQAYDLHPLTLEDVMNTDNLAKVDWYDDHFFLELTLQKLVDVVEHDNSPQTSALSHGAHRKRFTYAADSSNDADVVQQLDKPGRHLYQRFNMSVEQASVYLTASGTVITIFERSGEDVFKPIYNRLQSPHTVLRSGDDPSMLVQGVLDAVVDMAVPVGRAFEDAFTELELAVLTKPSITLSRQVYVLRAGLASFLDLLVPIGGLVRALYDHRNVAQQPPGAGPIPTEAGAKTRSPDFASQAVSPLTQAYLKDVQDHITTLTSSTHMRIRSAENLTSLIFNTIAARQNESVRQLTLVSIFFLPLTFLTGYFGMNFDPMPVVQEHSDEFFWFIASPVMGVTLAILMVRPAARKLSEWRRMAWRRRRR